MTEIVRVAMEEAGRCRASAELRWEVDEGMDSSIRGVGATADMADRACFQVAQGEKSDVVQAVDVTEPVVEVEAVQDAEPVRQHEDVTGVQIAVPVDDASGRNSLVEQGFATVEIAVHELVEAADEWVSFRTAKGSSDIPILPTDSVFASDLSVLCEMTRGLEESDRSIEALRPDRVTAPECARPD
ncbi:hypothetical protein [Nocardia sp. BMG51109]|uniref:hypothetical protein n=1 Tax=Nocardia sp. BMG51109 TaxID=1056816 RepID=UPI000464F88A